VTTVRRFPLDEVILRPGTYFNPETEVMIVVDDSPEVDHEIFEAEDLESSDWVLLGDEVPVDETRRDDIVERFQRTHTSGEGKILHDGEEDDHAADADADEHEHDLALDGDEDEEADELEAVEDLDYERE
jgi:hypothetical protein